MCNNRYYDVISVGASILIGVLLSVFVLLNLLVATAVTSVIGLALGAFCLLLTVIAATSLFRQNASFSACVCQKGLRLVISSLLLIVVSAFTLIFFPLSVIFGAVLEFFMFTLISYTLFSLYCSLQCIVRSGCVDEASCGFSR